MSAPFSLRGRVLVLALLASSCAPVAAVPARPLASDNELVGAAQERCSADRALTPYLIKLPSTERGALEARLQQGLVLVKYSGCELEMVPDCVAPPSLAYSYLAVTPKNDVVKLTSMDALYASVPIGAAELAAKLQSSGEIRIEVVSAGRYEVAATKIALSSLSGAGCQRATHAIRALTVGAFRLFAGQESMAGGGATAFGTGVSASRSREGSELSRDGEIDRCFASAEPDAAAPRSGCGALIQAEMVRIDQTAPPAVVLAERVCPPGMSFVQYKGCTPEGEGEEAAPAPPVSDRFVPQGGAVFDTTTGLTWQRDLDPQTYTWEEAKRYCLGLGIDGVDDWRLPRREELVTLVERDRPGAKIDTERFGGTPSAGFWTMSPDKSSPGDAWSIDFHLGAERVQGSGKRLRVRCVR